MKETARIQMPEPIGYLRHEPTHTNIAVFHKIPRFQRWFIKICFGLVYRDKKD